MSRRIIVDLGHPAHVHLFRNPIREWVRRGDEVLVLARRRGIIETLLREYGIKYQTISVARSGLFFMGVEFLVRTWRVLRAAWAFKPTDLVGTSVSIGWVSRIAGGRSFVFNEDDRDYLGFFPILAYTAAHHIVIPGCLRDQRDSRHITHDSFHELAYLHPAQFVPRPELIRSMMTKESEHYFIFRLVSLHAHHDGGHAGISIDFVLELIEKLKPHGPVYVNSERPLDPRLESYRLNIPPSSFQDALSGATYLLSDSQTTVMEAAVLGVPVIRINTFKGMCSVINELEDRFGLVRSFLPDERDAILALLDADLGDLGSLRQKFALRRQQMLRQKSDFTSWITETLLPPTPKTD